MIAPGGGVCQADFYKAGRQEALTEKRDMTRQRDNSPAEQGPPGPIRFCDGRGLKRLVSAGLAWLERHQQAINALNVYPVPDGDTGTNMLLTMQSAYREIQASPEDEAWISR